MKRTVRYFANYGVENTDEVIAADIKMVVMASSAGNGDQAGLGRKEGAIR